MMYQSPRRRLPRWASTLIVLGIAFVLVMPGPWSKLEGVGSTVLEPIQFGLSTTGGEISGVADTVERVQGMSSQNQQYRQQIAQLQSEVARLHDLEVENQDLRNLLGMQQHAGPGALLPVTVIARDQSPYVEAITIDRGTTGGVHVGSVVVTYAGLVGRVVRADPTSSKVLLVTDLNSSVAVHLQNPGQTTGVLRGQARNNLLAITYIPHQDKVSMGDVVVTSGMGGVFPSGLVVGKVARVEGHPTDPFQIALVQPAVQMDKLERLYVLAQPSGG